MQSVGRDGGCSADGEAYGCEACFNSARRGEKRYGAVDQGEGFGKDGVVVVEGDGGGTEVGSENCWR